MRLKTLVPIFALAVTTLAACNMDTPKQSDNTEKTRTEMTTSDCGCKDTSVTIQYNDAAERQTKDESGLHYGVHVGPHYNFSSGSIEIGPSIGLGYDF